MLFEENAPVKAINPIFGQRIVDKDDLFPRGYKDGGIRAYNNIIGSIHDYDMCMESASFEEIDKYYNPGIEEVDTEYIFESIVIQKFSKTEHRMNAVVRTLNKHLGDSEIKALPAIVGKPKKTGGFAYVTVQLPFSDGQTVSVIFHAPEGDQMKITANDTIIAFRWLLNKRDITHVVSPEEGEEVSLESIGVRITQLVKKNSKRFEATQKQAVEEKKELETTTQLVKDAKDKERELMDTVAAIKKDEITNDAELSNVLSLLEKQKTINAELQAKLDGLRKTAEQHRIGDGGGNKGVTGGDTAPTNNTDTANNISTEPDQPVIDKKFITFFQQWKTDIHDRKYVFDDTCKSYYKQLVEKGREYANKHKEFADDLVDKARLFALDEEALAGLYIALRDIPLLKKYDNVNFKIAFVRALGLPAMEANEGNAQETNLVSNEFMGLSEKWYAFMYNNEEKFEKLGVQDLYDKIIDEGDKYLSDPANSDFVREYNRKTGDVISSDREIAAFYLAIKNIAKPKKADAKSIKSAFNQALGATNSEATNNTGSTDNTGTNGTIGMDWGELNGNGSEENNHISNARKVVQNLQKKYNCFSTKNGQYQTISSDEWLDEGYSYIHKLETMINNMPKLFRQDGKGDNAVVGMHYFTPNSDFYITELDHVNGEIFGFSILNGDKQNAEMGYSSLKELADNGYEMDLYWNSKTLGQVKANEGIKTDAGGAGDNAGTAGTDNDNNGGNTMPETTQPEPTQPEPTQPEPTNANNTNNANNANSADAEIQSYVQEMRDIISGKYDAEGAEAIGNRLDAIAEKLEALDKLEEYDAELNEAADRITMLTEEEMKKGA